MCSTVSISSFFKPLIPCVGVGVGVVVVVVVVFPSSVLHVFWCLFYLGAIYRNLIITQRNPSSAIS
jgi:hypothetical protein